ncbi:hypothetical protein ABIB95_005723 [Bradyrhizobium sp. LA2.1]
MLRRLVPCDDALSRRPTALDDLGSAFSKQLHSYRAAEFARAACVANTRGFDGATARMIEHGCGEQHLHAHDFRKSRDRRVAMAVEHPQYLALGVGARVVVASSIAERTELVPI